MKMLRVWVPLALCLAMVMGAVGQASDDGGAAWRNDLATRRAELVKRNGPGTDAALHAKLMAMGQEDQAARGAGTGHPMYTAKTAEVDRRLTAELKAIVARHGWPTIGLVGIDASDDAMTVLTHTPNHAWQRAMLPKLERLAAEGKIDGSALATVVDKELVSEGKPQRYGTQFKVVGGKMAMIEVEDPEGLDARRAVVFLPPTKVYEGMLEKRYGMVVSEQVVPAR
ncbi:MAG: DUF6624 domain-containing protein [Acidobacteriaceae bacterium]